MKKTNGKRISNIIYIIRLAIKKSNRKYQKQPCSFFSLYLAKNITKLSLNAVPISISFDSLIAFVTSFVKEEEIFLGKVKCTPLSACTIHCSSKSTTMTSPINMGSSSPGYNSIGIPCNVQNTFQQQQKKSWFYIIKKCVHTQKEKFQNNIWYKRPKKK